MHGITLMSCLSLVRNLTALWMTQLLTELCGSRISHVTKLYFNYVGAKNVGTLKPH